MSELQIIEAIAVVYMVWGFFHRARAAKSLDALARAAAESIEILGEVRRSVWRENDFYGPAQTEVLREQYAVARAAMSPEAINAATDLYLARPFATAWMDAQAKTALGMLEAQLRSAAVERDKILDRAREISARTRTTQALDSKS